MTEGSVCVPSLSESTRNIRPSALRSNGYPADAFKTAYLRYVICLTLPVGVFMVGRWVVPIFRRGQITSVFEYLEARFGSGTRLYGASVFITATNAEFR